MSQQGRSPAQVLSLPGFGSTTDDPADRRRSSGGRRWIIIIGIIVLIVILGIVLLNILNRPAPVTYQYLKPTQDDLSLTVNATGPLQSSTYNLSFTGTSATINEIDVKVGQTVTKDQVLAKVDQTALQDAVNQQQAAVNAAQASLASAQATLASAANQANASTGSAQTGVSNAQASQDKIKAQNQASVDAAQTALDNANTALNSAQTTADAQIATAATQRDQALKNCNAQSSATATPAPTVAPDCKKLANDQYDQSVATANASVTQAQSAVDSAQKALDTANANADASNTAAQGQVNTANAQVTSAQANGSTATQQGQISTAQSQLKTALAQLATAQHNLDNTILKAPHDGTVTIVNGNVGGLPGAASGSSAASSGTGNTFIQIADLSSLQVQANVNESDTANLQIGQSVTFTVNAYGNRTFTGKVSAISPAGQTTSNVVTYPVTIDVDMTNVKDTHLLPSMTASVAITVVQHHNVTVIPVNAVNFARLASSGNSASGTPQLITPQQARAATSKARQMYSDLISQNANIIQDSPLPAFVIERVNGQNIAKPVVLGLTDGTKYEVLDGLTLNDNLIVGVAGKNGPGGGNNPGGGGGPGGGGPGGGKG